MAAVRRDSRQKLASQYPLLSSIAQIDADALEAWRQQWCPAFAAVRDQAEWEEWSEWDWGIEMAKSSLGVIRFDLAIWSHDQLCGLAVGRTSPNRQNFSICVVQGSPVAGHPLKGHIIPIVIDIGVRYGTALQCRELRFLKPSEGMISIYERFEFKVERTSQHVRYCRRPLE
jgi:hypothetical protein